VEAGNESEVPLNVSIIGVHLIIGGHHHYAFRTGSVDVLAGRLPLSSIFTGITNPCPVVGISFIFRTFQRLF
ncbi:hypothetical protein QSV34_05185, partial [Porticoccus sp. W117]|uniref:hypothetical protein n=1 Tax=Porticoccus sp. W117 TaxID=3054777 RepID=UPI002596C5C7